jgi:hypothetical protein
MKNREISRNKASIHASTSTHSKALNKDKAKETTPLLIKGKGPINFERLLFGYPKLRKNESR